MIAWQLPEPPVSRTNDLNLGPHINILNQRVGIYVAVNCFGPGYEFGGIPSPRLNPTEWTACAAPVIAGQLPEGAVLQTDDLDFGSAINVLNPAVIVPVAMSFFGPADKFFVG